MWCLHVATIVLSLLGAQSRYIKYESDYYMIKVWMLEPPNYEFNLTIAVWDPEQTLYVGPANKTPIYYEFPGEETRKSLVLYYLVKRPGLPDARASIVARPWCPHGLTYGNLDCSRPCGCKNSGLCSTGCPGTYECQDGYFGFTCTIPVAKKSCSTLDLSVDVTTGEDIISRREHYFHCSTTRRVPGYTGLRWYRLEFGRRTPLQFNSEESRWQWLWNSSQFAYHYKNSLTVPFDPTRPVEVVACYDGDSPRTSAKILRMPPVMNSLSRFTLVNNVAAFVCFSYWLMKGEEGRLYWLLDNTEIVPETQDVSLRKLDRAREILVFRNPPWLLKGKKLKCALDQLNSNEHLFTDQNMLRTVHNFSLSLQDVCQISSAVRANTNLVAAVRGPCMFPAYSLRFYLKDGSGTLSQLGLDNSRESRCESNGVMTEGSVAFSKTEDWVKQQNPSARSPYSLGFVYISNMYNYCCNGSYPEPQNFLECIEWT